MNTMRTYILLLFVFVSFITVHCKSPEAIFHASNHENLLYSGRVEKLENEMVLIGSASSVSAWFTGDTCVIHLKNNHPNGLHNFYSVELDNEDLGRFRIEGDITVAIPVEISFQREVHKVMITKSTEASNGYINVEGIFCETLAEPPKQPEKSIEFIGNSITCGMGNDTTTFPCHTDQWYDQHNAYWAYGPTVSRALKVNYLLSSVSGIGIYRNWNGIGPVMPEVYENLYLNLEEQNKRDFSTFHPDIVSICLGTNDLSDGDGINARLPFDQNKFTARYIAFVEEILKHYPKTQIALLNSPMVQGEKNEILLESLNAVKNHFNGKPYKVPAIFEFEPMIPGGCDYHPSINDHMLLADQLYPFYQELLEKVN
jgi:lysophospholipase L1-like esterase